jgi:hypothetical protein
MAVEDMKGKATEDYKEMARTWKNGYLKGLDACLQWQEESERLLKDGVRQGLAGSRQLLSLWRDWVAQQTQEQRKAQEPMGSTTNPFLGLTKQSTEAVLVTVEPFLKNSEAAVESSFGYYEMALATPSRKYVREINRQVLDAVIPT